MCEWDAIQKNQEQQHVTKKAPDNKFRHIGNRKLSRTKSVFQFNLDHKHLIYHCNVINKACTIQILI